jgi:membrane protein involved in colicin uptake
VRDPTSNKARDLSLTIHQLQADKDIAEYKNEQLQQALQLKTKHQKHSKPLNLQQRRNWRGGAVLWSPRKIREANTRLAIKEREAEEEKVAKAQRKVDRANNKLEKEKEAEKKRVGKEETKKRKEKEAAEKARAAKEQKQRDKDAATSQKLAQQANKLKRAASHKSQPNTVKKRRVGGAPKAAVVPEPAPAPPPKATSSRTNIKLPAKYR